MALITPQQETIRQYLADGVTTTYTYNYLVLQVNDPAGSDLNVYVTPSGQAANPIADLIPTTDYMVTGVGNPLGGTVIFNTAPPISSVVTLSRNMQLTITTQFADAQTFNGASLDLAFQRIVLLLQQMQGTYTINDGAVGSISRCLQYVVDTFLPSGANNTLPLLTNIDNQVWMSQGGNINAVVLEENPDVSGLRAQLASETAGADGTNIIGYFDENSQTAGTLCNYLNTSLIFGVDAGAVNALAFNVAASSHFTAYKKGMLVFVKVLHTNTGAATLNISSNGAVAIYRDTVTPCIAQDLLINSIVTLQYDGTHFVMLDASPIYIGADSSVAANTVTVANMTPALASYSSFYPVLSVLIANTNTGATVINVGGLGNKAVVMPDNSALEGGELQTNMIARLAYNGTSMQLLNPARIQATNADVIAGTSTFKFPTVAALNNFTNTGGNNGSYTFPGGLIIKWGISPAVNAASNLSVTYGVAFPTAVLSWQATATVAGGGLSPTSAVSDVTHIVLYNTGGINYPAGICWLAIGY